MELGVCYYPEQWPQAWWEDDAQRMVQMGIRYVRIAEFAWSRIEPRPGHFEWSWLDQAIETLHAAGLKVVMCTPTATPPKWLVDSDPTMLAVDASGQPRKFGSRRHYCFSSQSYRAQSARISLAVAERYGKHPAVAAWQTDNEYGCHLTVLSYSDAAQQAFRAWLQKRYGTVDALNTAWGNVFWSQEYASFDEIDAPVGTVTEANPAHRLDYRRFASDEVVAFNRIQTDILRAHSPGRDITHNFMGFFTEFDHHDVSQDLDVATHDSYPLGFTQDFFLSPDEKRRYARTGHPDIPAFHHDLYRGMCKGRWWVMEQQPGPVNWAQWNPAPLDGIVRLWTWQAFAHGAEVVSYFRWRQAPFAQEQMHAGLNRPDRTIDQGGLEATQVAQELKDLGANMPLAPMRTAQTAIVFDYPSIWMAQIQPQGADFNAMEITFRAYSALRAMGLDVDMVSSKADLSAYRMVVLPAHMREDAHLAKRLAESQAQVVLGPRSGAKNQALAFAAGMPPGAFAPLAGLQVQRVESLPPGVHDLVQWANGATSSNTHWREDVASQGATALASFADGKPAVLRNGNSWYSAGWPDAEGWNQLLGQVAQAAGLVTHTLPTDVRITRNGDCLFVQNFSSSPVEFSPSNSAHCLLGARELAPQGLAIWKLQASA
ncbi:beta-galactosidase [Rhodoferax aquaticus]|uniref:Beta-galactosidase n=1 Tax=Rhodoferax aquaticus TaxID=2527691 RepID=A0A515EU26_9BURK|nr:beta-galactosidase [Rhodoferax aquaticus]QDL56184.1 beta-galactosidase [Rhodoferax aquaticus]